MTAPVPFAPKPSIVDRVLGRLFPTAQYAGLLDQGQQQGLQHQGLLNLGMGVLSQTGAGSGPFTSLGKAYQGLDFSGMADHALALQNLRNQQQEQQAIAAVATHHPPVPGETPEQRYDRQVAIVNDLLTIPGGAAIAEHYAPVLAATKPNRPLQPRDPIRIPNYRDNILGSPTHGMIGTGLFDPVTNQRVGFVPQVQKPLAGAKTPLSDRQTRATAQQLLSAHLDGIQLEQQDVIPSTAAATVGGIVQKIAGTAAGQGVTALLRRSSTNAEQQAAGRWADAAIALMPHSRSSVALREKLLQNYWPQEGDTPENVQRKVNARKAASAAMARSVAAGVPPILPEFEGEAAPSAVPEAPPLELP